MAKIPSKETITADELLDTLQGTSSSVKNYFIDLVNTTSQKDVSATAFSKITADLAGLRMALTPVIAHPDADTASEKKFGRPITQDAQDVISKIDAMFDAIKQLIPANKAGFLDIIFWDTDGTWGWKSFAPDEMNQLRTLAQGIIDSIE